MGKLHRVAVAVSVLSASVASAQVPAAGPSTNYPAKSVRILVGFAPGGGIDIMARFYAQRLTESLGQSFVVENRPGAGGTIATDLLAKAAPDGSLYSKPPYDSVKDFAPVTTVALQADCIAVHPSVPVKSVREVIAFGKANPDKLRARHATSDASSRRGSSLVTADHLLCDGPLATRPRVAAR